jgi:AcrR family transcriptional regulator
LQPANLKPPRVGAGRPTREQALLRHEALLDTALEVFLERGYEQATLDAIAAAAGAAKRTLYARYEDKAALFKAAVQRAIERFTVPIETLRLTETEDLEETLTAVARMRVAHVASPVGLRLQRILNTESYRFPEIFNAAFEQGTGPMIAFLTEVLQRHAAAGRVAIDEPERAATVFMSMVVGGPTRILVSGNTLGPDELEDRIAFSVRLFLNGALARPTPEASLK